MYNPGCAVDILKSECKGFAAATTGIEQQKRKQAEIEGKRLFHEFNLIILRKRANFLRCIFGDSDRRHGIEQNIPVEDRVIENLMEHRSPQFDCLFCAALTGVGIDKSLNHCGRNLIDTKPVKFGTHVLDRAQIARPCVISLSLIHISEPTRH